MIQWEMNCSLIYGWKLQGGKYIFFVFVCWKNVLLFQLQYD